MSTPMLPQSSACGTTASILLVEDDLLTQRMYSEHLAAAGYHVTATTTIKGMRSLIGKRPFDLLVVDMGLPDGNGLNAAREMAGPTIPVIGVTANDNANIRIAALEAFAVDFLVKPFDERELTARVRNALRPSLQVDTARINFQGFTYQPRTGNLSDTTGRSVPLSTSDQKLLYALVMNHGRALSREWLATELLGRWSDADQRIIDVQISRLRKKLAPSGTKLIRTVRHVGYLFDPESGNRFAPN